MAFVFNPFTGTFCNTGSGSGSASNSFTIMQPDSGTAPTASSSTDTLTLHNSDGNITVSGNSSTKTITFNLASSVTTKLGYVDVSSGLTALLAAKAPLASPTFTGSILFSTYHLEPFEYSAGNSSTAQTINWSNGSSQVSTLTGNVTYTFSNPVSGASYVLRVNTGAGSFTATWPAAVKWSGATAPTITTAASKNDLINFYYDGTNYYGSFVQNF